MDTFLAAMRGLWAGIEAAFRGPFGGFLGGVLTFFVLDMGYRRHRDRRDLARGLAAELENTADRIEALLNDAEPDEIGEYVHFPNPVFNAVANRLGELRAGDVVAVTKLYGFLDDYNRMPAVWAERARRAGELPPCQQRESELHGLIDAAHDFHRVLTGLGGDCRRLALQLRLVHLHWFVALVPRWVLRRLGRRMAGAYTVTPPETGRENSA